ncbi:MAG: hypothetical protein JSS75_11715 [Bacteroidetes bacterium]|nr:hypothetical protein [Bacteroidota bacterium]
MNTLVKMILFAVVLCIAAIGSPTVAIGADTLRAQISSTSSSIMAITQLNDTEYSIVTTGAPLSMGDGYRLGIADTSIVTQWGTDSITFVIPNNGQKYYYVPFDTSSGAKPIYSGLGGSGAIHCRCNPWHPEGDVCRVIYRILDMGFVVIVWPECDGTCMDADGECAPQSYIIAHNNDGYSVVYGPFSYLVLKASNLWYNGTKY